MRLFRRNCWKRVIHCWRKCQPKAAEVQLPRFDHFISFSLSLLALFLFGCCFWCFFCLSLCCCSFSLFALRSFSGCGRFVENRRVSQNRGGMGRKARSFLPIPLAVVPLSDVHFAIEKRQFSNTLLIYC